MVATMLIPHTCVLLFTFAGVDPYSTLGRSQPFQKIGGLSASMADSLNSPSNYELKSEHHPVSQAETDTKIDLSTVDTLMDGGGVLEPDTSCSMAGDAMTKTPLDKDNEWKPSEINCNQPATSSDPGMNGEEQQQEGKNIVHLKVLSAGEEAQVGSTEGRGLSDDSIVIENPTAT